MDDKEIARIKKKYKDCFDALEEYDRTHKLPKLKKPKSQNQKP